MSTTNINIILIYCFSNFIAICTKTQTSNAGTEVNTKEKPSNTPNMKFARHFVFLSVKKKKKNPN